MGVDGGRMGRKSGKSRWGSGKAPVGDKKVRQAVSGKEQGSEGTSATLRNLKNRHQNQAQNTRTYVLQPKL